MKKLLALSLWLCASAALAQHSGYSGQQARAIKALSAEEVQQYLAGAGMGYAKAAELNRYPGPMHALELAEALGLTPGQREALTALLHEHKAQARAIGERLVAAERELDRLFASGEAQADSLRARVQAAGALRAEYRLAHLETHLRTRELLTPAQVELYDAQRGYAGATAHRHGD
jgi:Spy/CpxP family protein refolding chaperone